MQWARSSHSIRYAGPCDFAPARLYGVLAGRRRPASVAFEASMDGAMLAGKIKPGCAVPESIARTLAAANPGTRL
ncbi:MAG: hypothetical protein LC637_01280 [Xanthomonadaceae bacterium]|nr:hypothetical protein [Xanthomonadaceae bacterium]